MLIALLVAGCASGETEPAESQRLQARAAYERGLSHVRDGQPSLGLAALKEAIGLDGTVPLYHNALGVLYLELRRPDMALPEFQRATELDPGYAEARLNTGIALAESQRWEEAVAAYRSAISLPTLPYQDIAYQNLGLGLYHLGRYAEAEEALRFALSLDPRMAGAYYNLGLVFLAEGRPAEAKLAFQRARDLAPQSTFGQAASEKLRGLDEPR